MKIKIPLFLFIFSLISACGNLIEEGVVSLVETELTTTTLASENILRNDAELLIAKCLRVEGYEISDPSENEGLRQGIGSIIQGLNQSQIEELLEAINKCAEENNITLGGQGNFNDPEQEAERLDQELELAQCLREEGIDIADPTNEVPLRQLFQSLVLSEEFTQSEIRGYVQNCFQTLGLELPGRGNG